MRVEPQRQHGRAAGRVRPFRMTRFFWRRTFPSIMLVAAFVLLYEATVSDSRYGSRQAELLKGTPRPDPRRASAIQSDGILQRTHDRVGRCRAQRRRRGRSGDPSRGIGHSGRFRIEPVRRRLHDHGHRPGSAGQRARRLHVELLRRAALRPAGCTSRRAAARMEPEGHDTADGNALSPPDSVRETGRRDRSSRRRLPRAPRPERIPDGSVAPLPNPTFEKPEDAPPSPEPPPE